jgi:hypothetical protein
VDEEWSSAQFDPGETPKIIKKTNHQIPRNSTIMFFLDKLHSSRREDVISYSANWSCWKEGRILSLLTLSLLSQFYK